MATGADVGMLGELEGGDALGASEGGEGAVMRERA